MLSLYKNREIIFHIKDSLSINLYVFKVLWWGLLKKHRFWTPGFNFVYCEVFLVVATTFWAKIGRI